MPRAHKFTPGRKITSIQGFLDTLDHRGWIYYSHKPTHQGWARSWRLRTILIALERGWLREAIPTEELKAKRVPPSTHPPQGETP